MGPLRNLDEVLPDASPHVLQVRALNEDTPDQKLSPEAE